MFTIAYLLSMSILVYIVIRSFKDAEFSRKYGITEVSTVIFTLIVSVIPVINFVIVAGLLFIHIINEIKLPDHISKS